MDRASWGGTVATAGLRAALETQLITTKVTVMMLMMVMMTPAAAAPPPLPSVVLTRLFKRLRIAREIF
eukprot:3651237-Pyramimonas_sp.AAC.1